MHPKSIISAIIVTTCLSGCSVEKMYRTKQARAASPYEQVDFHALIKRYLKKDKSNSLEGIYSVSGTVSKKGKGFLGSEKEKTVDRKENYAQVAILYDPGDTGRDYIELSLDQEYRPSYSIVGEFNMATGGNILLYKHLEGKSKNSSFTFTTDKNSDMLEGIRVDTEGNTTVTYKLTYIKIYPK